VTLRPSGPADLAFVTGLERHAENRDLIGQWADAEHAAAIAGQARWSHWIVEENARPVGFIISRDCRAHSAGIYVKRVLIGEKNRGLGKAALAAFLAHARRAYGTADVWLTVRNENLRAQAVYRKQGFAPFDPQGEEAERYDAVAEAPADRCFRMRLAR
jgi:ribosomal protein S18 acetylase RimI-like enzyme